MSNIDFYAVGMQMRREAESFEDRYNILAAEGHADDVYAIIASDGDLNEVAISLMLSEQDLMEMLTRTSIGQHKMLAAKATRLATKSLSSLASTDLADSTFMMKETAAAAKHHKDMLSMGLKVTGDLAGVNKPDQAATQQVIIHSTVSIGSNDAPPAIPHELHKVLEHA